MEPKELLTKRRIEKLAEPYEGIGEIPKVAKQGERKYDVFVSHSSRDEEFIRKVLLFLRYSKGGIEGYVDWQDPDMDHETDARTAEDLKDRIRKARKVIYVVTTESLKSSWCSWEIGYSDCSKGVDDLAILAVKPNNGKWKKREFLQQYPWIYYDLKEHMFMVRKRNGESVMLFDWLNRIEKW